jgi:hypothetical protein
MPGGHEASNQRGDTERPDCRRKYNRIVGIDAE